MRAYDIKRLAVEYARIHRIVPDGQGLFPLPAFIEDIEVLLRQAIASGYSASWQRHEWTLGNLERVDNVVDNREALCAQFGWREETPDPNAPPAYSDGQWSELVPTVFHGAVAVLAIEGESQRLAITSRAGEISTRGVCHALGNLLNHQEISRRAADAERPGQIEWIVDPITESGAFRSWLQGVDRLSSLTMKFHLPNPNVDPVIEPIVKVLTESYGTEGQLTVKNKDGRSIDPFANEIVNAGIEMQEHDYGSINAHGEANGQARPPFRSADHQASDVMDPAEEGADETTLTWRTAVAMMLEKLSARLRSEGGNAHSA